MEILVCKGFVKPIRAAGKILWFRKRASSPTWRRDLLAAMRGEGGEGLLSLGCAYPRLGKKQGGERV